MYIDRPLGLIYSHFHLLHARPNFPTSNPRLQRMSIPVQHYEVRMCARSQCTFYILYAQAAGGVQCGTKQSFPDGGCRREEREITNTSVQRHDTAIYEVRWGRNRMKSMTTVRQPKGV